MSGGSVRPIGWYVHHHGAGHVVRARAVAPFLPEMVVLSSLPRPPGWDREWVELPRDDEGAALEPEAGGSLHWAPLGDDGLRARMSRIVAWIEAERPVAFVVDVSVEVALLARLHGVPTVIVGQRGRRDDQPHSVAFASARGVVVPWTEATHIPHQGLPDERLRFLGAISRFPADGAGGWPAVRAGGDVLALLGFGGCALGPEEIAAAAEETPERTWHLAGPIRAAGPPNLVDHGPDAPVEELLGRASVVVGCAGGSTIAEVAAARRHFLCVPQRRPFDEQLQGARALKRIGAAEVRPEWPAAGEWAAALAAAEARPVARWAELADGNGAARLAETVRELSLS